MIFLSRQIVKDGKFKAPWKYFIVDEFQDASLSRLELVTSLRKQRSDSRLTCIGDDWQAIIRFAGGDIRVMTQFEKRVGPFWKAELGQTFRYPPIIAEVSTDFITGNPDQLKKAITPAKGRKNLPIRIIFAAPTEKSDRKDRSPTFNDVLSSQLNAIRAIKPDATVFLLSRYRFGIPEAVEQEFIRLAFPTLQLTWSTVHRSKGSEADAVIISDMDDGAMGFPCLKEDDPIIRKYLPPEDSFEHAEERRLFYVGMTRAKHQLTLIANAHAPSPFITEIIDLRSGRPGIEVIQSGDPSKPCPKCQAGIIVVREGPTGRFFACTKSPVCSYTEEACPRCRRGFLMPKNGVMICSKSETEGCKFTSKICPKCKSGWLVVKTNRTRGNRFWGCSRFSDERDQCKYTENP
jgi:DNA helicase-4